MIDRIDDAIGFHRTALNLRSYRQELLASNIANADTPNYKARDVDFKSALQSALSGKTEGSVALARTQSGHLPGVQGANPFGAALRYRSEYQGSVDGNTVNMDIERAAFAENAMQTEAMLTFINGRFKSLATAIQGQ
ncbi:MAG: flagellar basal body rod protein FlgB [Gammaproteobacteria bacterium]|nr:flagellar basal body rod protein FlgB [Gammaproteobacteria bacterium]MBU1646168.1 flagellar basal body rod protein FlgB [Gammaproteobacteria bacterium]MBU1972230.1 flagellar basal body rod protein FlgB [Gammaproteobacteria bacterium]